MMSLDVQSRPGLNLNLLPQVLPRLLSRSGKSGSIGQQGGICYPECYPGTKKGLADLANPLILLVGRRGLEPQT